MIVPRSNLVRLGALLALALVLAWTWLQWTDGVAAQQAGKNPAGTAADKPRFEIPPADAAIMRALDEHYPVDFKETSMKEVLEFIRDMSREGKTDTYRLNFILDEAGLKEFGVNDPGPTFNNDPVTKQFKRIKVRTLLNLLLAERGMKYYLDDGNVILTKDKIADKKLIVRMYPVANLVGGEKLIQSAIAELQFAALRQQRPNANGSTGGQPGLHVYPFFSFWAPASWGELTYGPLGELLSRNIDGLTNQIKGTVDPDHWQGPANGPGSMVFIPANSSLQILCSLEVHYLLMASGLLDNRPLAAEKDGTITVRTYSLSGLLDPKNRERSKADLEAALKILGVEGKKSKKSAEATSTLILVDSELLLAKQPVEMQHRIERLLFEMRGLSKLNHSAIAAPGGPAMSAGPLPANLGGITFGNNGGNGAVVSRGGVFGSGMGVFGAPAPTQPKQPPPAENNFLGK